MGVTGFREAQESMEKVSSMKAEVDERKGQALEDISGMVVELNHKIAEKKARLAPIIKGMKGIGNNNLMLERMCDSLFSKSIV